MAIRASHATTRSARYALGAGADLPVARIVAILLIILPIATFLIVTNLVKAGPSESAVQLANFDPQRALSESTPHFLPKPVAAMPPETDAGPPAARRLRRAARRHWRTGQGCQHRRPRRDPAQPSRARAPRSPPCATATC